jgi:hypothetical protein
MFERAQRFLHRGLRGKMENDRRTGVYARGDLHPQVIVSSVNAEDLNHPRSGACPYLALIEGCKPVIRGGEASWIVARSR